jgi:uncharacterized membrane protein YphA (DoxX/SURF4 family)
VKPLQGYSPGVDCDREIPGQKEGASRPSGKPVKGTRHTGKIVLLAVRMFLGGIFIYASIDKIIFPGRFAEVVYNYQILPDILINFTAVVLPWLEVAIGVSLVFGVWLPGSVFLCNLLLLTFLGALLFNTARGLDINCGCFTTSSEASSKSLMAWYLIRDIFLLLIAAFLFFKTFSRNPKTILEDPPPRDPRLF